MGLLDIFASTGDPERDAARNRGLLAAGLQLMQAKGRLFPALGQAGMAGLGASDQYAQQSQAAQARQLQQRMAQLQMQQLQREEQIADLPRQVMMPGGGPAVDATGGMETATGNPNNIARQPGIDLNLYLSRLQGIDPVRATKVAEMLAPKQEAPTIIPKDAVAIGRDGKQIFSNVQAGKPGEAPGAVKEYEYAKAQGYKGTFEQWKQAQKPAGVTVSYGSPVAGVDGNGNPVFFQPDKAGGRPAIIPGVAPAKADKPMTEAQAKAATFKSQMESAEKELASIPLDMSKVWSQGDVALASGIGNFVASPSAQRARQAQEQWAESFLRFKTGAAATKDEVLLNVRTFFPQPGDSKEVIEQKKRMRQGAARDIEFAATGKMPNKDQGVINFGDLK